MYRIDNKKVPGIFSNYLGGIFDRRTKHDYHFILSKFTVTKIILSLFHVVFFFVFAFGMREIDGITASMIQCHIFWFIYNLIPIAIGISFKNRKRLIVLLESGIFILHVLIYFLMQNSLQQSVTMHNIYYDYSIFYNSNMRDKVLNFFTRKLGLTEALFVLLPLLIGVHVISFVIFELKFLDDEQKEVDNIGTWNIENSALGSIGGLASLNVRTFLEDKCRASHGNFLRTSKSRGLNRFREALSMGSFKKIEHKKGQILTYGSYDKVKENVIVENGLDTFKSKTNLKYSTNLLEELSDSEISSLSSFEIDAEEGVKSNERSSLRKGSSQESFEKSESTLKQETEKEKSKLQNEARVTYEVVRPLDKRMKPQKPFVNRCEKSFIRSSKSSSNLKLKEGSSYNKRPEHLSKKIEKRQN